MKLWIVFATLQLIAIASGQVITCDNATCANGKECSPVTLGDDPFSINCECGINTYGENCEKCFGSEKGTWTFYDDITGEQVGTMQTNLAAIGIAAIAAMILMAWRLHADFHAVNAFSALDYSGSAHQMDMLVPPKTLQPKNTGPRAIGKFDDYTISFIFFITGMIFFTTFTFTPKIYADHTPTWFQDLREGHPEDCHQYPGFIFMGLFLMILSGFWILFHWMQISGVIGELYKSEGADDLSKTISGSFWQIVGAYDSASFWRTAKAIVLFITVCLITGRWMEVKMNGSRTCCERLITSDSTDQAFMIVAIVLLGLDWVGSAYFAFHHVIRSTNFLGDRSGLDVYDRATVETLNASFWGSKNVLGGKLLFGLFYLARWGFVTGAIVVLSMDAFAYGDGHDVSDTEPLVKGTIFFFVSLTWILIRTFCYYWNVRNRTVRLITPEEGKQQAGNENAALLKNLSGNNAADIREWLACRQYADGLSCPNMCDSPARLYGANLSVHIAHAKAEAAEAEAEAAAKAAKKAAKKAKAAAAALVAAQSIR
jgi:hypothetical protein